MSIDTFSQNTSMGLLNQGQGHDGSAFDEDCLNSIRGIFLLENQGISILRCLDFPSNLTPITFHYYLLLLQLDIVSCGGCKKFPCIHLQSRL